jgi:hypothetical protein
MPGLAGLVQTAVAALFTTSETTDLEAKWHQPWPEPVRGKIAPQLAVALIASGVTLHPLPFVSFGWFEPLPEPVRIKSALPTGEQQFLAFVKAAPFAETVTEDRWHQAWSEPVRVKPRLAEALQQALAFAPPFSAGAVQSEWAGPPSSLVRFQYQAQARPPWPDIKLGWLRPLAEPVRVKPALGAGSQQVLAFGPQPLPFLGGGGGWYLPDPTRPPARNIRPSAPRQVAPKVEPPTFADVLGSRQPARLADVLGAAFAQTPGHFVPEVAPALDLYVPSSFALRDSDDKPKPIAAAVIDDIEDRLDALAALRALDEMEREEHEALIAAVLRLANSE